MGYKNFKNQDFKSLKDQCAKNGQLFEDPEFPATDKALYFSKQPSFKAEWKRPKEISSSAQMFIEGASAADVTQGRVGNCWFVAAAASLALEKELWKRVIPDHKTQLLSPEKPEDYQGIFHFRFWRFGEWTDVVIDDRLPTVNGELIFIKSKEENEFWSALLEKAYAKMAGSYEALESGNPADALVDFTGGVSETIDLVKGDYKNDLEKRKEMHQKLVKLLSRNAMSSASIKVTNREEMEQQLDTGLVKGHAYGLSDVKKIDKGLFSKESEKIYLVKLRNPWGQKEWNGPWSDGSAEWNTLEQKHKDKIGVKVENDGEFWMSFDDFCRHFTTVTLCMLVNTSNFTIHKTYNEGSYTGKWEGRSAGGCINNKETFLHNPQIKFEMTGNKLKDVAFISLMQPDMRALKHEGKANNTMGFHVMRIEGNRSYRCHQMYEKAGDSSFINSREVFVRLELDPGRYVVVPSTFEPNTSGDFLLRVYTDNSNSMRALTEEQPEPGCFSCFPCCKMAEAQLSITVTEINNLKKKGSMSMTVDPYVVIECEGTSVKSHHLTDNVNPKLNYGGVFYVKKPDTAQYKIQVWDHNMIKDTFLGETSLQTIDTNDRLLQVTHQLMQKKDRNSEQQKADGTVTIRLGASRDLKFM